MVLMLSYDNTYEQLCAYMTRNRIEEEEMFNSHNVVSLFTNTPIDKALELICSRLEKDSKLKKIFVPDIIELLKFVLLTTYISFGGKVYQQKFGSSVSQIVANLYMEGLEQHAIATAPIMCAPRLWKRFVDDILEVIKKEQVDNPTQHLNPFDVTGSITFTYEEGNKEKNIFPRYTVREKR